MMTDIAHLPLETLTSIFLSLSLKDRKSVRLTCQFWYDVCNCSKFTRTEKFVLRYKRDLFGVTCGSPFSSWSRACRSHWEFHGLPLMQFPLSLWETCGVQIQILFIYNCEINEETFVNIVFHCTNLTHFYIESDYADPPPPSALSIESLFCSTSTPTLDNLIREGIRREKLISFEVYSYHGDENTVSMAMYAKIFKIYPNIRTFGKGHRSTSRVIHRYTLADDELIPLGEWAFPPEELNAPFWILPTSQYKEFKSSYIDESEYAAYFFEFFSFQPKLERVWLNADLRLSEYSTPYILSHILESLPKLRELQYDGFITAGQPTYFSPATFYQFLEYIQGLEALALRDTWLHLAYPSVQLETSVKFTRLKKLYLGPSIAGEIVTEILTRCGSSLQFVGLDLIVDREMASKLFEFHTGLETLLVNSFEAIYPNTPTADYFDYSCDRLRNLKRVDMKCLSGFDYIAFLTDLDAPDLEYFSFPACLLVHSTNTPLQPKKQYQIMQKSMKKLVRKAPLLKILCFDGDIPLSVRKVTQICKRLEKLKIIHVKQCPNIFRRWIYENYAAVERLFTECPSLCWLSTDDIYMYSYDHNSKKLLEHVHNVCTFEWEHSEWCKE